MANRPEDDAASSGAGGGTLASVALTMLLSSLGTSIANVALPVLAEAFDASFSAVQWIVIIYLLAITALIVGAGRLGDLVGRRRLLLAGTSLFTLASAACGVAPSLPLLIVARAGQGLGAAIMMALSMALAGDAVPKSRTGSAIGLLATASAVGTALGPTIGGGLIAVAGWRAVFFAIVPLGLVAVVMASRYLPADPRRDRRALASFDWPGALLMALALSCYGGALASKHFDLSNAALLALAAALLALFVAVERRTVTPLLATAMFRDRLLSARLAANSLVTTVMMATLVVGPFYLARGLGLKPVGVGLAMSVGPVVAAIGGVPAGRFVDRYGAGNASLCGLAAIGAGSFLLSLFAPDFEIAAYVAPLALLTAGYALFQAANNTAVLQAVDSAQRGLTSGLLNLSRNLGLITGAAALGAVFAHGAGPSDVAGAAPKAIAAGTQLAFGAAVLLTLAALAIETAGRMTSRTPRSLAPGT